MPQDAATAALALLPTVAWLLGDAQAAEDSISEGLAHVERLDRDFDRALLHAWIAGTRYTQRRYDEAEAHAERAVAISQAVSASEQPRYRDWYATGLLMKLLSKAARAPEPDCLGQAIATCMEFASEGVGLNASYYWGLARGYARMDDRQTADAMLDEGFRRAEASEETRMNAELLLLKAELEPDDTTARPLIERALRIAEEEGAITTALRAAVALVLRSNPAPADREEAEQTLARSSTVTLRRPRGAALDARPARAPAPRRLTAISLTTHKLALLSVAAPSGPRLFSVRARHDMRTQSVGLERMCRRRSGVEAHPRAGGRRGALRDPGRRARRRVPDPGSGRRRDGAGCRVRRAGRRSFRDPLQPGGDDAAAAPADLFGSNLVSGDTSFTNTAGQSVSGGTAGPVSNPPPSQFYLTSSLKGLGIRALDDVTVGIGLAAPFGLQVSYPESGPLANVTTTPRCRCSTSSRRWPTA